MIKTQVQIPDDLYRAAKQVDEEPWELPRVNEGEGPAISLADIQRARAADQKS